MARAIYIGIPSSIPSIDSWIVTSRILRRVDMYYEITYLREKGYTVNEKSPWHYEVIGKKTLINVWPTKRKWMIQYGSGASFYSSAEDLYEKVDNILGKKRNPRWLLDRLLRERDATMTEEQRIAYPLWKEGIKILQESSQVSI